ncbi:uncharacterized protein [Physcomitrium patens]|uniref:Uncharacterized protein n=1 Tax=Physcomitrium patens TaxID=3218 RepID=A0A2K1KIJ8_PHYPA|nr:uncharacterized protein LOC112282663 [Physcomitrium patens]XP_024376352.1 uncharacterized protein LOC112282663 [Physcomitrium patens]XP_024376353.1 uncharacterized protein LOC112282663 [Physcomitrium patens]PNR53600.1 hypothetical protein PHYPA_007275 [Physcomitrium patens]|eukprot:XP_024376351.1 uncharacterized protein LOC112282663 [Physcomitrella patens]
MLQETGDAGSAAMGSPVSPEQVLKTLMNDGHFDSLRIKILNQLKQSEEIKNYTSTLVASSKVLNTPGAENKSRKELFEALRKELEEPVLEKASVAAWGIILDKEGVGKEIVEKVDAVYARLSEHDSSDSSPQYNAIATQGGQERPGVDGRSLPDLSIPSTSANGALNRMPQNQVYPNQAYVNQRTPTDHRSNTPWNDVSVTPGHRFGVDRGSTPRTDNSGPPPSVRRLPQPEYYHAPDP